MKKSKKSFSASENTMSASVEEIYNLAEKTYEDLKDLGLSETEIYFTIGMMANKLDKKQLEEAGVDIEW